jgi:hypothetical protein
VDFAGLVCVSCLFSFLCLLVVSVFFVLCEKFCFNPVTTLLERTVLFCFYNVFLGLLGCGVADFSHKSNMVLCWVWLVVDVKAC